VTALGDRILGVGPGTPRSILSLGKELCLSTNQPSALDPDIKPRGPPIQLSSLWFQVGACKKSPSDAPWVTLNQIRIGQYLPHS